MPDPNIFISHRAEDSDVAKFIKLQLLEISKGRLSIFVSEDIPQGRKWRERIEDALNQARYLFLIYRDPSEDWSWCFYEVGYFQSLIANDASDPSRLIYCFLAPDAEPPGPISHLQQPTDVPGIAGAIAAILRQYDVPEPDGPANQFAQDLVEKITVRTYSGVKRIRIEFLNDHKNLEGPIPREANVIADPSVIQAVFGYSTAIQWSHIQDMVLMADQTRQSYDIRWFNEIVKVVDAAKRGIVQSPQCVLFARNSELRYRFVLSNVRTSAEGRFACEFIVCEDVSGPPIGMPASLISLMTSIRMAARIKHEVLGNGRTVNRLEGQELKSFLDSTRDKIFSIMTEAETRGSLDPANLLQAFDDPKEKSRLEAMMDSWPDMMVSLGIDFESWKGSQYLSKRLTEQAASPILYEEESRTFRDAFERLYWANKEFLAVACRRLGELFAITEADRRRASEIIPGL